MVWWFDSEKNLNEQFIDLANEWNKINSNKEWQINLYLPLDKIIAELKEKLGNAELNWLLIFDNIVEKEHIGNMLPIKQIVPGLGHILITSKNPNLWDHIMKLDKFTRNESISLLAKITNFKDQTALSKLAEGLSDYPLALVQAASYLKSHLSVDANEYLELFMHQREALWKEEEKTKGNHQSFANYQFTVQTTMSLSIKKIKQESPQAYDLLVFCSLLSSKNIPEGLLKQYLTYKSKKNNLEQEEIISTLVKYSLITTDEELTDQNNYTIHEINQFAVQNTLGLEQKQHYLNEALTAANLYFSDKLDIGVPILFKDSFLLAHLETLQNNAMNIGVLNNNVASLALRELEYYLAGKRDFVTSSKIIEKIDNIPGISDGNKCRLHLLKSTFYAWKDYDYHKGIKEAEIALKLLQHQNNAQEDLLMAYNRLMQCYNFLGDNEQALKYAKLGEKVVKSAKGFLGNQDAFYQGFAKIYMDLGKFDQALEYTTQGISYAEQRNNGNFIPGYLTVYILAGEILIKADRNQLAVDKLTTLYAKAQEILPNNHLLLLNLMIIKSYGLFLTGNDTEIQKNNLIVTAETLKELLGKNYYRNRVAALNHKFLGDIYDTTGEYGKALTEYIEAEKIFANIYGSKKIEVDDISDLYSKIAIANANLGDAHTAQHYLTLHQQQFGLHNWRSVKIAEYFVELGMKVGF